MQDLAADTARQETMLKLVSTTLSKSTGRLVEATIKEQVKYQVIPSIGKLVSAAVQDQIGRGIAEGMKEVSKVALVSLSGCTGLTARPLADPPERD